jgi:CBS domain-containing protein
MFVSDLMNTQIFSVGPDDSLAEAARIMLTRHVGGLPVMESGRLIGIVTQGDLLRRVEIGTAERQQGWFKAFFMPASLANEYVHTHGRHVSDVMTRDPLAVTPATALSEAADLMCAKHFKCLPVVVDGELVGMLSRTDLLTVLARRLLNHYDPYTESEIRTHILDSLAHERWAPKAGIRVNVTGNEVTLEGTIYNADEQRAVRIIAETTPGVKVVHDHLILVDPASGMSYLVA